MDFNKTHTTEARAEMLRQAEERSSVRKSIRETSDSTSSKKSKKKHKKEKKCKKSKSHKKSKKKHYSDSESDSASDIDDEWVEKELESKPVEREDWMTTGLLIKTYNKSDLKKDKPDVKKEEKQSIDSYDPAKSIRELNPYWKDGGTGLPTFQRPAEDSDDEKPSRYKSSATKSSGNWRKTEHRNSRMKRSRSRSRSEERRRRSTSNEASNEASNEEIKSCKLAKNDNPQVQITENSNVETSDFLTDQQMNELGAKLIKAEILGNDDLVNKLREKLEKARACRNINKTNQKSKKEETSEEFVLLTKSDIKSGYSKPLERNATFDDKYGGNSKKKDKRVDTHVGGERVRYFADDDKYDIKTMYEKEKFTSASDQDAQFAKIIEKHTNPNDELEDIFSDKIRKNISESDIAAKEKSQAIKEHTRYSNILENCNKCFESGKMDRQLIVKMGKTSYLSLPWHEGLTVGHCLIIPQSHCVSSTAMDEDVWREVTNFRAAITQMYATQKKDVIFFECARFLHKQKHMKISCIASSQFELAPFYFKKAIQESETEWAMNKKLIDLKDKDVRRAVPKNLPYFWVHFGMNRGFAHVIEDQEKFPSNFAEEIIGGLLNLDTNKWRKPRKEYKPAPKVKQFSDWWKPFDTIDA